jgi:GTP-binding protein
MIMSRIGWRTVLRSSHTETEHPVIVILGRTNTGKSTLFNRLLASRRAITDPTPGVTRDPIEARCRLNGREVVLVDTGGFSLDEDAMQQQVRHKMFEQCAWADLILFVVDIEELTPEDEEFRHRLHPFRDKIILVVNKMDNEKKELLLYEKYALGFQKTIGISAEHGRNVRALTGEMERFLSESTNGAARSVRGEAAPDIVISLLGRPNTGKSTFLNRIVGMEKSIVSEVPGTTRDVIEGYFNFKRRTLKMLDTAGIRRKNRIDNPVEYYSVNRAIKTIEDSDVVILVVDARAEFSEQDKKIAGLVLGRGKGLVLALNKWDLVSSLPNAKRAVVDRIHFLFPDAEHIPTVPVSAKTGEGVEKVLSTVIRVREEMRKRIDTGELNRAFKEWKAAYDIPLKKNIRIRYITQEGVDPVRFIIFVNTRRGFPQSYLRYLKNRIREQFGFRHVPVQIEIRKSQSSTP